MIISLDPGSPTPPYAQLQEQIATMVRSGVLAPGARLPAIRHLATDLGVATGTVARAYRELKSDGVVQTRGRHGTSVCPPDRARRADPTTTHRELAQEASAFALAASHRGLDIDQAVEAVRAAFRRLAEEGSPS
ncbi:MAG: GntR family transcriptional regulator [Iamia sp.]